MTNSLYQYNRVLRYNQYEKGAKRKKYNAGLVLVNCCSPLLLGAVKLAVYYVVIRGIVDLSEPYDVCMNCGLQAWRDGVCDRCQVDYQKVWTLVRTTKRSGSIVRQVKFDAARAGLDEIARLIADRLQYFPDDVCIALMPND